MCSLRFYIDHRFPIKRGVIIMKYCAYCGAPIVDSAASFCSECGKALKPPAQSKVKTSKIDQSPSCPAHDVENLKKKTKLKTRKPVIPYSHMKRSSYSSTRPQVKAKRDPRDEGYDGYYNDVKTLDKGQVRDRTDPELIKRIAFISAGALIVIIFAVIMMYLL
jgi:predicted nucleic acid-binding Zn ribbon protein